MTPVGFAQRSNILVNALPSNPFWFPLITVVTLIGLGSISGCTDKATELHERKCTNIRNLIDEKSKNPPQNDLIGLAYYNEEMSKLRDEFTKECK